MTSISLRTFGCRVNQAETFSWAEAFARRGLRLETDPERGDVVVVNSCTVTARADRDVRRFVARLARTHPGATVVLAGCFAERGAAEAARWPGVRLVVPNADKDGLVERVAALAEERARAGAEASEAPVEPLPRGPFAASDGGADADDDDADEDAPVFRSRGLLKVQDGCDNACAYCVVPGVRGRSRSFPADEVVAASRALAAAGYLEITLAGIHLTSYGAEGSGASTLVDLLRGVEAVEGLWRVRLSSLDPRGTDDRLLAHLAGNPRVCRHFHFSFQHASERVLREMGRPFAAAEARRILEKLAGADRETALGADLLVGFPGETGSEFEELREFLISSPLTYAHVFAFSPRPGTRAAALKRLPDAVVAARAAELRRVAAEKRAAFVSMLAGRTLEGVVVRRRGGGVDVLTDNYVRVAVDRCPVPRREVARVRITGRGPRGAAGEIVADPELRVEARA